MRYTDCTFVTPVFNGSASLRNAAGQLIEDVNKSVRRHQTVNAEYLSSLYSDVSSLYRLDQIQVSASGLGAAARRFQGAAVDRSCGLLGRDGHLYSPGKAE